MTERAILHIDMNNFYASVECMLNPELKPFPIAVCGSQEERHGMATKDTRERLSSMKQKQSSSDESSMTMSAEKAQD